MHLVITGTDFAVRIDDEAAIDQFLAAVSKGYRAKMDPDPRSGCCLSHLAKDLIIPFAAQTGRRPIAVAIKKPAHLGGEQHHCPAFSRVFYASDKRFGIGGRVDSASRLVERDFHSAWSSGSSPPSRSSA